MYTFAAPGGPGKGGKLGAAAEGGQTRMDVGSDTVVIGKAAAAPATMPPPVLTSVAPRTTAKRPRTSWL